MSVSPFETAPLDVTQLGLLQDQCASLIRNSSGAGTCTCGTGDNDIIGAGPFPTGQPPFTDTFQVSFYDVATSLIMSDAGYGGMGFSGGTGDNTVRIVNPTAQFGTLCAMIYVFDDTEQLEECCGCPVTPDGMRTLSVDDDLTLNFGVSGSHVTSGTIEIISSTPNFAPGNPPLPIPPGTNFVCSPTGGASNDSRTSPVNPIMALRSWITVDELVQKTIISGSNIRRPQSPR